MKSPAEDLSQITQQQQSLANDCTHHHRLWCVTVFWHQLGTDFCNNIWFSRSPNNPVYLVQCSRGKTIWHDAVPFECLLPRFNQICPVITRVPNEFRRRFRTKSAREFSIRAGTALIEAVPRYRASLMLGDNCSEHRTKHHSHSAPSVFSLYGGSAECSMDFRARCAAFTIRRSDSTSMTTLLQSKRERNASRIDCSVSEGSHSSNMLSGRYTILTKPIPGASGRRISCTSWTDRYLQPGIFCPYKNEANSLFDMPDSPNEDLPQDIQHNESAAKREDP